MGMLVTKFLLFLYLLLGSMTLAQTETYLSENGTNPETTRGESRLLHYQPESFPVEVYIPSPSQPGAEERSAEVRRAFSAWEEAAPDIVDFEFVEEPGEGTLVVDWQPLNSNLAGSYRYRFGVLASGQYSYQATRDHLEPCK